MAIEGIIFSDLFIESKDVFVDFFSQLYQENSTEMTMVLNNLQKVLNLYLTKTVSKDMVESFEKAWKDFEEKILFNNQSLQLVVAYRGSSDGSSAEFSQIVEQDKVMRREGGSYGINSAHELIQNSMAALKATDVENFLRIHLTGFLKQLEDTISRSEAETLHDYHEYMLASAYQNVLEPHLTGKKWRQAFFGDMSSSDGKKSYYYSGQGLGKAYDAFMNHLANKETGIFNYLASGGMTASWADEVNFSKRDVSVYIEEGGIGPGGNYPTLLHNATNNTGWWTGGDIVIVNPSTMQVVYNIQLKTTTRKTLSVFAENVEKIRQFIKPYDFNNLNVKEFAENLFDFLKTSVSNTDIFNNAIDRDIENLLKQNLKTKGITFE